jgi:hypothetical protein
MKMYYNSPLEKYLSDLVSMLRVKIPGHKELKPIGLDFGKGNPI